MSLLKLVSLWAAAVAATVEEAFFRQLLMNRLAESGAGLLMQILASAILFGLAHAIWGLIRLDLRVAISSAIATTLMGLFLAAVYLLAARNLAPCIISHFIITGTVQPGLIIAAVSGQWDSRISRAERTADAPS